MKFRIVLFLILKSSCLLFSQNNSNYDIGIEGIATTKGVFSYPSIGIKFNKIKIRSGILIGKDYINSKTTIGAQADIIYFPNKENKKTFNFFFVNSINYFRNSVSLNQSGLTTNFIQVTLGYGFKYYLSDVLFIKNNFGLGALLENRKFNFDTNDPPNKWGAAGIISLGIVYRL